MENASKQQVACKHLQNDELEDKDLMAAVADAAGVYYNSTGKAKCFNISQQAVSSLGDEGWYFQVFPIHLSMFHPCKGRGEGKSNL